MRRNTLGQTIQAMMQLSAGVPSALVPLATKSVTAMTGNGTNIVVTTAAHGIIPGNIVTISGSNGNTAANGRWVVYAASLTTFSIANVSTGTAVVGNGTWTSGGTVTPETVSVYVTKDGGIPALGANTPTYIGKHPAITFTPSTAQVLSSIAAATAGSNFAGSALLSNTNGAVSASTHGLWSYSPTAAETNANNVMFTFTSPAGNSASVQTAGTVRVSLQFEPTSGPIMLQTIVSSVSSLNVVLSAGSDENSDYSGCMVIFEDHSDATTVGRKGVAVVASYSGSTKTLVLQAAPTGYTIAASNLVTIVADPSLKPVTPNATIAVDSSGQVTPTPIYLAKLGFEQNSGTDKYRVKWYKNAIPQDSGVTSCNIQVVAESGSNLVASTAMTDAGSNDWKYSEATNIVANGVTVRVRVTATIDSATRTQDFIVTPET